MYETTWRRVMSAAEESPTRDEWQVIVSNPPAGYRGAILNSVPPGDAYTVGKTIILGGFYDDAEARHVASSITHKYRGSVVTYGPKSTFGVNEDRGDSAAQEASEKLVTVVTAVYGNPESVYGLSDSTPENVKQSPFGVTGRSRATFELTFFKTRAPKRIVDRIESGGYHTGRMAFLEISP